MYNKKNIIKATIKQIIVAFVYIAIFFAIMFMPFSNSISEAISLIDLISVDTNAKVQNETKEQFINLSTKNLSVYPEYGSKYANIKIPSINVDLPLYFGDTLNILKNGVGQSSFGYFPGEGGTILCMAHNTANFLKKLPNVNNGDLIEIQTDYGKFIYKIYDTKIVNEDELEAAPIQRDEEILMLYTCYPTDGLGHAVDRYVVYANLVEEEIYD